MIELGSKVKDRISGFTGIVTSQHIYLNGCQRVSVAPEILHDNKPIEAWTFDIQQLQVLAVPDGAAQEIQSAGLPGGPHRDPVHPK